MALRIIFALGSFVLVYLLRASTGAMKNDGSTTQTSANEIGKTLTEVMKKVTKFEVLQNNYRPDAVEIEQRKGDKIVQEMKKHLEEILQNKIQSILNLADEAEKLWFNYTWDKDITLEDLKKYTYIDSKFLTTTGNISLQEEVSFSKTVKVNLNYSTVHVPTDVYNGSELIVNSVKWTKGLDEVFIKNRETEPSLLWQYFGTSTGVYRVYPGYKWKKPYEKDFFDHRRRRWYIQGSSSPKDMVILLDLSGSMAGSKLAISKLSARFLLDTLQENDFVNIVTFNNRSRMLCEEAIIVKKYPYYAANCTRALLQATKQNKQYLKDMVNVVQAVEIANVSEGFRLAAEVLKLARNSSNQSSSGCIRTINFFTDGVEESEKIKTLKNLKEVGAKEAEIRVFGYVVGREKGSPYQPVQTIACAYRGYFYTIETLSDVRENVTSYLNVLSRPLALQRFQSNDPTPTWTPLYRDKLGLGLMITVVAPVYDRRNKDKLLGVVGTDVALPQLVGAIARGKIGVNGYGFAINNNGFIVIHPILKEISDSSGDGSAEQYGNPNLSLEDVNLEDSKQYLENLSHDLIDRKTGSMVFKMRVLSKDKKRVSAERTYNFDYTDINGTSFSAAIAMTNLGRNYFSIDRGTLWKSVKWNAVMAKLKSRNNETVMVAPWSICHGIVPKKRADTPLYQPVYADAEDLIANLTDHDNVDKLCDRELLYQLLYGAKVTYDLDWDITVNDTNGYLSVFVGTNGGFSRVLAPEHEIPISSDVTTDPFYQRASEFDKGIVVVSTGYKKPGSKSSDDSVITASTPIYLEKGVKKVLAAVIGMQMKDDVLQEILLNSSEICKQENDTWSCYLIDEDGFVVASTAPESKVEVGQHFGAVHGQVFQQMVKDTLYEVIEYKDANYKCPEGFGDSSSSAMRLINPLLAVSSYVTWMTQTLFWTLVQFNIFSFFSGKTQVFADESSDEQHQFCTAEIQYYKSKKMNQPYSWKEPCSKDTCMGKFYVAPVLKTNLRLVVLQSDCSSKSCPEQPITPKKPYFVVPTTHYRKLPQLKCYSYSSEESKECGSGCSLSPMKLLMTVLTLVYLCLAH